MAWLPHSKTEQALLDAARSHAPQKPPKPQPDPRFSEARHVVSRESYPVSSSPGGSGTRILNGGPTTYPITLSDGVQTCASLLRWRPLLEEMTRLNVPGIDTSMGKFALIAQYAKYLDAQANKPKPGEPGYETRRIVANGGKWVG